MASGQSLAGSELNRGDRPSKTLDLKTGISSYSSGGFLVANVNNQHSEFPIHKKIGWRIECQTNASNSGLK